MCNEGRVHADYHAREDDGTRATFSLVDYPPPPPSDGAGKVSIDGGPDGLRLIRHIVRHATALDSELAITIGSYSSPRAVTTLLRDSGYRIIQLTLGALPLGDHRRGRRRGFSSSTRSSDAR
jgi:hypothetical protein